jgi:hypothetical protein
VERVLVVVVFIKREDGWMSAKSDFNFQGGDDGDGDELVVKYERESKRFKGKSLVLKDIWGLVIF